MKEKKLMYQIGGQMMHVQLYPVYYLFNRSLGVYIYKAGSGVDDEDSFVITCCLDAPQAKNCAYIDVNNCGADIVKWLEEKLGVRFNRAMCRILSFCLMKAYCWNIQTSFMRNI